MSKKTWLFFLVEFIFLALLFSVGLFILAPNAKVVDQTFVSIGGYFCELGIKAVLAIVISLVMSLIFFKICLKPSGSLKDYFISENNDSHAFLIVGIVASVIIALFSVKGISFHQYLYNLCIKMPIGYLISTIVAVVFARLFGVKNMEDFRNWMETKNNDSYAIIVSGILVLSMILTMSV